MISVNHGISTITQLEKELISALYAQRSIEFEILSYSPQESAPEDLRARFCKARVRYNEVERQIRLLKYGF